MMALRNCMVPNNSDNIVNIKRDSVMTAVHVLIGRSFKNCVKVKRMRTLKLHGHQ